MKKFSNKKLLILLLAVDIVLCGTFALTNMLSKSQKSDRHISESNIQRICELATLDCYYHNVSNWSQDAYGVLAFTGYGEKKVWIEYDGMVRLGINAGKIKISEPDNENVITVTMPEATILDIDLDESTISEISSDRTVLFFTDRVNTEDRRKALAAAQDDMKKSASENTTILGEAQERAKKIIERNIIAAGEASGKHYKVKFINGSSVQTTPLVETP